jgi:hypothetical protein
MLAAAITGAASIKATEDTVMSKARRNRLVKRFSR